MCVLHAVPCVCTGNQGSDISSYSPGNCAATLVVTAIAAGAAPAASDAPALFSNYALAASSHAARVVAAPGVRILSSVSPQWCARSSW